MPMRRSLVPRVRSLLVGAKIDEAGRAHNCKANVSHRINRGDKRLKVPKRQGRGWDHYCLECAEKIVARDFTLLSALAGEIDSVKT